MSGFGNKLIARRASAGLTLKEAANKSGLKLKQVKALEEENFMLFKNKAEAASALQALGTALGLQQAAFKQDFDQAWQDAGAAKAFIVQKSRPRGFSFAGSRAARYAVLAASLVLLTSAGSYYFWAGAKSRQQVAIKPVLEQGSAGAFQAAAPLEADVPGPQAQAEEQSGALESLPAVAQNLTEAEATTEPALQEEEAVPAENAGPAKDAATENQPTALPRSGGTLTLVWSGALALACGLAFWAFNFYTEERHKAPCWF